jgi:hypothetical protein
MFDYQAGEKYKLTLIMVGFAGLMAGMLFTLVLMPQQESPRRGKHHSVNWSTTALFIHSNRSKPLSLLSLW